MTSKRNNRTGATAVEFAIVLPMLLAFVLGLVEWGRFEMVRQVTSTAAFNACRAGTIPGATAEDVEERVDEILDMYFVKGATTTTTFFDNETQVNISVPMDQNSFMLNQFFGDMTLERDFTLKSD